MPYRHLFRQQAGSPDFHNHAFRQQHPQLAIVDPDSIEYTGWHEMDFTTAPLNSPTMTSDPRQGGHAKSSATMDSGLDSLAYLRASNGRQGSAGTLLNSPVQQRSPDSQTISPSVFNGGPYSYSQLLHMDANTSPLDQSSIGSSRADGDSNMLNDDDGLTSSLSLTQSLNTSPPVATLDPIAASIVAKTDSSEKLCPLIAGQVDSCQPQRCGPDAPCMNFTTLPPIEDCTAVPCITGTVSPQETMITSDSLSVPIHRRPKSTTRMSTSSSNRSSATRRSSISSNENRVQSVPLPSRKAAPAPTPARRRTRNSAATSRMPKPAPSDEENEEEVEEERQRPATKSTAPSKSDAKQRAKQAHSLVERKYRENLNAKITQLHHTLQSSHYGPRLADDQDSDNMGEPTVAAAASSAIPASKVRKSDVLSEAMNYVNQTEVEMRHMENEIHRLGERVRVLEKLVRCEDCSLLKQVVNLQVQAAAV